jgi:tripartite-type tricarboxylate transporter receptor subunit TctC
MNHFLRQCTTGLLLAASTMVATAAPTSAAEAFPSKPVTLLVAFPPGGPADAVARAMEPAMTKALGQPVIIENVPGALGVLAMQRLMSRPADGYTLIMGSPNEAIFAPLANPAARYKAEDLALIAPVSSHPLVVMARPGLPATSLAQLVAASKQPGGRPLTFGSPGHGSMYHVVSEYMAQATGARLLHVPYKGATPMLQDLAGGQIDITILPNLGGSIGLLATGRIKALTVLADSRMSTLPEVAPISESDLPHKLELVHSVWVGVMAKAGLPAERAGVLLEASHRALQSPEVARALALSGVQPMKPQSLAVSTRFYADEIAKLNAMARSVKLLPQ